jgi:ribosomal protein S18 acetylase RimI-like enzyme
VAAAGTDDRTHVLDAFFEAQVPGVGEFAEAAGYSPHTYGFIMRRALAGPIPDASLPAGLEIRPVREETHRAIWDADTEAFLDHDEPAERDESDFVTWFAQPAIDTSLWRVAWAGDEVAGSVMTIIWPEENEVLGVKRAWLEHVSVRRPWRGRGVASALIAVTLDMLRAEGLEEAMLGVHGENPTGAVGLYERAGFRVHRRWSLWRKAMALRDGDVNRATGADRAAAGKAV